MHQASEEEEEESNEERRTASLGDLSKFEQSSCASVNRPSNGTLERAQSLEMSDANNQMAAGKVTPKKRKAHGGDLVEVTELKEPRSSEPIIEGLEQLHTTRLKSSYEWGNLEDAIYDGKDKGTASDDSFEMESPQKKLSSCSMDMMSEVLAAADKFDREINDIELNDVMNEISEAEFDLTSPEVVNGSEETVKLAQNEELEIQINSKGSTAMENGAKHIGIPNEDIDSIEDDGRSQNITQIKLSTAEACEMKTTDNFDDEIVVDQMKNTNYGTNISDDAKVSRYPLSSLLERPKSEVLKQLKAQQAPEETDESLAEVNGVSYPMSTSTDCSINIAVETHSESNINETNQLSPFFSSDGSGINNISISSIESDTQTSDSKNSTVSPTLSATENRITISNTSDSQPTSIVIEDETLNFKMQTLDDEPKISVLSKSPTNASPKSKNEVFIVESLSSKKAHETSLPVVSNGKDSRPPAKGFVTEIRFPNTNKDKHMNAKNLSKSLENRNHSPDEKDRSEAKNSSPNNKSTEKTPNEHLCKVF